MTEVNLTWLDPSDENSPFPSPEEALEYPEGLVAAGGDLSHVRLLRAYREGIFPWYENQQTILWWSPDPRGLLYPRDFIIHRSFKRLIRKNNWRITFDQAFRDVILGCAEPRSYTRSTWITNDMVRAYYNLHQLGHAHSVETWDHENNLIGGVYGIAIGKIFFAESMFSRTNNASKFALLHLAAYLDNWKFEVIDTQLPSAHLSSLGGIEITRSKYLRLLQQFVDLKPSHTAWQINSLIDIEDWIVARNR